MNWPISLFWKFNLKQFALGALPGEYITYPRGTGKQPLHLLTSKKTGHE